VAAAGCSTGGSGGGATIASPTTSCYVRGFGAPRSSFFVIYGPGRLDKKRCSSQETVETLAQCIENLPDELIDPGARIQVQDCLKQTRPETVSAGGTLPVPTDRGGIGGWFYDSAAQVDGSSCGTYVNPKLAEGTGLPSAEGVHHGERAIEYAEKSAAVVGAIYSIAERTRFLDKLANANDQQTETIQDDPDYQKMKDDMETTTDVANEVGGMGPQEKSWWQKTTDWLSGLFSSSPDTGGGGGMPVPNAEDTGCHGAAAFLRECERIKFTTSPCKLFLSKLQNPHCDPLVALTAGDEPCALAEPTEADLKAGIDLAKVKCWSLVNPVPPGDDVCGVRTQDGNLSFLIPSSETDACSSPEALTTEDQCIPEVLTPQEAEQEILPNNRNAILNIILGLKEGQPHPEGPGPK
jgi:hypothetical protein